MARLVFAYYGLVTKEKVYGFFRGASYRSFTSVVTVTVYLVFGEKPCDGTNKIVCGFS